MSSQDARHIIKIQLNGIKLGVSWLKPVQNGLMFDSIKVLF